MESNKSKRSRRKMADKESQKETSAKLTGNENNEKNIFIEMDPSSTTNLLVTEPIPDQNQQVETKSVPTPAPEPALAPAPTLVPTPTPETALTPAPVEPIPESVSIPEIVQEEPVQIPISSVNEIDEIANLPDTVTKLTTVNGSEVYLIGTAHFSPKSVQDVQNVIRTIQPSAVILELCQERAFMLSLDEAALLEQNKKLSFDKIKSAIAEKGLAQGLIFIMFIKMSVSLTEKLGLAPGAEFRAGANEAQKIPRCAVILGDRSLKLTVARAVASVSTWQKIKLIFQVLTNDVSITQEDVEKCKEKDILEQMLHELGGEFPGFKRVLLDERNIYLAHSIYHWAQRSETSFGPQRVVAIVGIGHVGGIIEHWGKTTDDDIRLVSELPTTSKTRRVVTKTIKYCSVAMLFYVCYRTCVPSNIQNAIYDKITGR